MNWIGPIFFLVGVVCAALGVTYIESSELLLTGIILSGAGFMLMWLRRR